MINQAVLVGRMTKDCDLRYTPGGKAVGSLALAVDRGFKNAQGEKEVDFINCVIWGKAAENTANYTKKGSLIGITGRIQVRNYEKDGNRVYVTEVVAENVKFLDTKGNGNDSEGSNPSRINNPPTSQNKPSDDIFANGGQTIDISDDDLPF